MSVAERTRRAVREDPALYDALRTGVVNYSAAARTLDVEGDEESIATALRRFAQELEPRDRTDRRVSVRLHRNSPLDPERLGGVAPDGGDGRASGDGQALETAAAIEATGDVDPGALEAVLGGLRTAGIDVETAGVADERLVVAVANRASADALRVVERALETQ